MVLLLSTDPPSQSGPRANRSTRLKLESGGLSHKWFSVNPIREMKIGSRTTIGKSALAGCDGRADQPTGRMRRPLGPFRMQRESVPGERRFEACPSNALVQDGPRGIVLVILGVEGRGPGGGLRGDAHQQDPLRGFAGGRS